MKLQNLERFYRWHSRLYDLTRPLFLTGRGEAVGLLAPQEGERVIDWGCGTGLNFPLLLRKRVDLVGVDASPSMLRRAGNKFPGVELVQGDMATLHLPVPADKAICTYSLSMVDAWESAVRNIWQGLKPGGRLVILDFVRLDGPLRPIAPLFSAWLKLHGVNPGMSLAPLLRKYFRSVEIQSPPTGYRCTAVAEFPVSCPAEAPPPSRPFRVVAHRFIRPPGGSAPILSFDFKRNA